MTKIAATGIRISVEEVAAHFNLEKRTNPKGEVEFFGYNPFESGAESDGFTLFGAGNAYDRKLKRAYPAYIIAQFFGCAYEDYEGSESHPGGNLGDKSSNKKAKPPKVYDTRTLEERGLSIEAARHFRISHKHAKEWGEYRQFPTFHHDGREGQHRRKWRNPELQLKTAPQKTPAKTTWDNYSKSKGIPLAYGLNEVEEGETVVIVNSELAVWLFWKEGITAVCPLGEGRKQESWNKIFKIIKDKGAEEVHILLDNDKGGQDASVRAARAARDNFLDCIVFDLSTGPKKGYDASDLWEFWNERHGDMRLADFLLTQKEVTASQLSAWAEALEISESLAAAPGLATAVGELGLLVNKDKTDNENNKGFSLRQCPKCTNFAVTRDVYSDNGGFICTPKAGGCKARFEPNDPDVLTAKVKMSSADASSILLDMLKAHQLFHTTDGGRCIVVAEDGIKTTYEINSKDFKEWVRTAYYIHVGKAPKESVVSQAVDTLSGLARHFGPQVEPYVRTALHREKIYIDLCNKKGEVVEIDGDGWRVISESPVFFRRGAAMLEMPHPDANPERDNATVWEEFKGLINIGDQKNWALVIAWMVSSLYPAEWPCPVLFVNGEQGSAKSFLCRLTRMTVDPSRAALITTLTDPRETVITAEKSRVFALDNQENMEKWASNLLCALITGGSLPMRKLFTDNDQYLFNAQPAFIINGIPEKIGGTDLNDRALKIYLPKLLDNGYTRQILIMTRWRAMHARLLAALFDAISCGLKNLPNVEEIVKDKKLNRMADFEAWVYCCMDALPIPENLFSESYSDNIAFAAQTDIERFFSQVMLDFMNTRKWESWKGTTAQLFDALKQTALDRLVDKKAMEALEQTQLTGFDRARQENTLYKEATQELNRIKDFPATATTLGTMIKKLSPSLRKARFLECVEGKRTARGHTWMLSRVAGAPSPEEAEKMWDEESGITSQPEPESAAAQPEIETPELPLTDPSQFGFDEDEDDGFD